MYDIYINDISCIEQKILPTTRPDIPAPVKNFNEYVFPVVTGNCMRIWGHMMILRLHLRSTICVRPISGMTHSGSVKKCF